MANELIGIFDPIVRSRSWFDGDLVPQGIFDRDQIRAPAGAAFDPAFMAAMQQGPNTPIEVITIVACGMKPTSLVD